MRDKASKLLNTGSSLFPESVSRPNLKRALLTPSHHRTTSVELLMSPQSPTTTRGISQLSTPPKINRLTRRNLFLTLWVSASNNGDKVIEVAQIGGAIAQCRFCLEKLLPKGKHINNAILFIHHINLFMRFDIKGSFGSKIHWLRYWVFIKMIWSHLKSLQIQLLQFGLNSLSPEHPLQLLQTLRGRSMTSKQLWSSSRQVPLMTVVALMSNGHSYVKRDNFLKMR